MPTSPTDSIIGSPGPTGTWNGTGFGSALSTATIATTAIIADVQSVEAEGTSTTFPRGDHVHAIGFATILKYGGAGA